MYEELVSGNVGCGEPHVCGSDGFIFISVAHLSFLPISNAVDREIKLEMWNATCVSFD